MTYVDVCRALIDKADAWSGGFDVLILNAGILASFYFTGIFISSLI